MDVPCKRPRLASSTELIHFTDTFSGNLAVKNMQKLRLALESNRGVCLIGKPSCGKSTCLKHLAKENKQNLVSLYIDNSIDSKVRTI